MLKKQLKLQRRLNRIVDGKEYSKYIIILPKEQIDALHWHSGEDLESSIERNRLIIKSHKVK